jgi:hypothetical protein
VPHVTESAENTKAPRKRSVGLLVKVERKFIGVIEHRVLERQAEFVVKSTAAAKGDWPINNFAAFLVVPFRRLLGSCRIPDNVLA